MDFLIHLACVSGIGVFAASTLGLNNLGLNKWIGNYIISIFFVTTFLTVSKASPAEMLIVYLVIFLAWSILGKTRHKEPPKAE